MIHTWSCDCQQYLCLFHIVFEYIPGKHDQGEMLVLPNSTPLFSTFHIGLIFCFFPANLMSSTYTDKNNPFFHCVRISIPNWKPSPNRTSIGFSEITFPITALPNDNRTDSAQEEQPDLPYWTMIWAICALVDVSKYLDILILEFSIILEHLPF